MADPIELDYLAVETRFTCLVYNDDKIVIYFTLERGDFDDYGHSVEDDYLSAMSPTTGMTVGFY